MGFDRRDRPLEGVGRAAQHLRPGDAVQQLVAALHLLVRQAVEPLQQVQELRAVEHRARGMRDQLDAGVVVTGLARVMDRLGVQPSRGKPAAAALVQLAQLVARQGLELLVQERREQAVEAVPGQPVVELDRDHEQVLGLELGQQFGGARIAGQVLAQLGREARACRDAHQESELFGLEVVGDALAQVVAQVVFARQRRRFGEALEVGLRILGLAQREHDQLQPRGPAVGHQVELAQLRGAQRLDALVVQEVHRLFEAEAQLVETDLAQLVLDAQPHQVERRAHARADHQMEVVGRQRQQPVDEAHDRRRAHVVEVLEDQVQRPRMPVHVVDQHREEGVEGLAAGAVVDGQRVGRQRDADRLERRFDVGCEAFVVVVRADVVPGDIAVAGGELLAPHRAQRALARAGRPEDQRQLVVAAGGQRGQQLLAAHQRAAGPRRRQLGPDQQREVPLVHIARPKPIANRL